MTKVSDVYPDKWLRAQDLEGVEGGFVDVTVDGVTVEELRQVDGSRRRKVVLAFAGARKRLPLNKTQAYAVAKIAGTDEVESWVGVRLRLAAGRAQNGKKTVVVSPVSDVRSPMSEVYSAV